MVGGVHPGRAHPGPASLHGQIGDGTAQAHLRYDRYAHGQQLGGIPRPQAHPHRGGGHRRSEEGQAPEEVREPDEAHRAQPRGEAVGARSQQASDGQDGADGQILHVGTPCPGRSCRAWYHRPGRCRRWVGKFPRIPNQEAPEGGQGHCTKGQRGGQAFWKRREGCLRCRLQAGHEGVGPKGRPGAEGRRGRRTKGGRGSREEGASA